MQSSSEHHSCSLAMTSSWNLVEANRYHNALRRGKMSYISVNDTVIARNLWPDILLYFNYILIILTNVTK